MRIPARTAAVLVAMALLFGTSLAAQAQPPCQPAVTGRLDLIPSGSRVLHNERYLRVWVPPGYGEPSDADARYPILYMMDGQTLFGDCPVGAPPSEWHIDETLTRLIAERTIQPIIVVGIDSMFREYELTPYRDPFFLPDSPEPIGRRFPDFLAQDIIPLIEKTYRVVAGPQAIGGSSYGAVAALWALIARPDLFAMGLLDSPSLGVGNGQLLRDTQHLFKAPARVFVGAGDSEFQTPAANQGYVNALTLLEQNFRTGIQGSADVRTVITPGATHSIDASGQRFASAVSFLFGRRSQ